MLNVMTADEIKAIREALGMTAEQLAERIDVAAQTVRRWECNRRTARGPVVKLLLELKKKAERRVHVNGAH